MLERKIMFKLLAWKEKKNKMALVIKGARQVGKTFIIDKFARENYKKVRIWLILLINIPYSPNFSDNILAASSMQPGQERSTLPVSIPFNSRQIVEPFFLRKLSFNSLTFL